ncbi:MAG: phosphoribosyltransferase [Verrucomicrobia bacterium]|nr:phosphoribosyltransferase [Verrucomicrobiota bacterium]
MLLFPPLCLHCQEPCEQDLCVGCSATLVLLESEGKTIHAALPQRGAASTLLAALRSGETRLATPLAGFLVTQLEALHWPFPEVLVPLPRQWPEAFSSTLDASFLLAQGVASLLRCPVLRLLKRHLSHPLSPLFSSKCPPLLAERRILVVADQFDEAVLKSAQRALEEVGAHSVRVLAFVKAGEG